MSANTVPEQIFPELIASGYKITSPPTIYYNCLAWAAKVDNEWWDPTPGYFWPNSVSRDGSVESLINLYEELGFEKCLGDHPESGYEKVAVYGDNWNYTHAARQLPSGKWTSKLGQLEDIEHNSLEGLSGEFYGEVMQIMKRSISHD